MNENGKITISNPTSNRNPLGWVSIQVVGVDSKSKVNITMELAEFALALMGQARTDCDIEK